MKTFQLFGAALLGLTLSTLVRAEESAPKPLYPGERIMQGAGYPALTRFIKGDPTKALIVFIPGAGHTARIAYGGHAGGREEDFLAHWLVAQGYSFLGISYPIATKHPVDKEAYPDFTIRSWGKQAAAIAKATVDDNKLSKRIILVVWSNAGRSPQSFNEAAVNLGLEVDFCTSFSATPPSAAVTTMPPESPSFLMKTQKAKNGYMGLSRRYDDWYDQVRSNSSEDREIIPKEIYRSDYVGDMPVNLIGLGMKYQDGGFVASGLTFIEDSKAYDLSGFPLMTTIVTDNAVDSRHALTDQALWASFLIGKVYVDYIEKTKVDVAAMPNEKWQAVLRVIRTAPRQLSVGTSGNHFFFVGEPGARRTAQSIMMLEERVHAFRAELGGLLGIKP